MQRIEWRPSACAPQFSPMEIYRGRFFCENGEEISIPAGHTLYQGWGSPGPIHVVGDDMKPIPFKLEITWLSFTENKCYKGIFHLPVEKMKTLFSTGFIDRMGRDKTYTRINVGMAPGGVVVVWLIGSNWSTEVERYQAQETNVSMKAFAPDAIISMDEYVTSILNESLDEDTKAGIDLDNIPFGEWDRYRETFNWKPIVRFKKGGSLTEVLINFCNGESLSTTGENPVLIEDKNRAVPNYIRLKWKDKNNNEYGAKVLFDVEEVFEGFKKIKENPENIQTDLVMEVDVYNSHLVVKLVSNEDTISLAQSEVKVYETTN